MQHAGVPDGRLRYVLTARTIDLDQAKVPNEERWKAEFTLAEDDTYDPKY